MSKEVSVGVLVGGPQLTILTTNIYIKQTLKHRTRAYNYSIPQVLVISHLQEGIYGNTHKLAKKYKKTMGKQRGPLTRQFGPQT
jgi:hypothetical protein